MKSRAQNSGPATVALVDTGQSNKSIVEICQGNDFASWIFIGRDAFLIDEISSCLPPGLPRIDIAEDLGKTQRTIRQEYLEFTEQIEASRNKPHWWARQLACKNPWISNFLLRLSQVICTINLIEKALSRSKNTLIVVEEPAVQKTLAKELKKRFPGCRHVNHLKPYRHQWSILEFYILGCLKRALGIYRNITIKRLLTKNLLKTQSDTDQVLSLNSPIFLCPTFIDSRSFRNEKYADAFLGPAVESIYNENKNRNILLYPVVISMDKKQMQKFAAWMSSKPYQFVTPLTFFPYWKILWISLKAAAKLPGLTEQTKPFQGIDVGLLINLEHIEEWSNFSILNNSLIAAFAENLGKKITTPLHVIYPFESQPWERILLYSLRKHVEVKAIGIQNAPCPSLSTRYFISPAIRTTPLPDYIIANGKVSYDLLSQNMGNSTHIIQCASNRPVQHGCKNEGTTPSDKHEQSTNTQILLTCSTGILEAREIIFRTIKALGKSENIKVWVAFHPLAPKRDVMRSVETTLPRNFTISDCPLEDLFEAIDLILFDSSTVGLQALSYGIPALYIGHECAVHVDPTEHDTEFTQRVFTIEKLEEIAAGSSYSYNHNEIEQCRKVANLYFGETGESLPLKTISRIIRKEI